MAAREGSSALSATASKLDPDIERFARELSAAWSRHGDVAALGRAQLRLAAEEVRAPWRRGGPAMARVSERTIPVEGGVRVRVYEPVADASAPALIYLHGGGWTMFSLDTHDRIMREYAARAGMAVIGIDYALAPEKRYPVALDQVVAVARSLAYTGFDRAIDRTRLAIGGDSAGANLALAAALRLRDEGSPDLVGAILLNYGAFDRQSSPEAVDRFGGPEAILTAEEMDALWSDYLRDERDALDPFACPILAQLQGLPPVFLTVPECDLLTEQSLRLGERLRAAAVPVRLEIYQGACHSFLEAVSIAPLASRAFDDASAWLRATL